MDMEIDFDRQEVSFPCWYIFPSLVDIVCSTLLCIQTMHSTVHFQFRPECNDQSLITFGTNVSYSLAYGSCVCVFFRQEVSDPCGVKKSDTALDTNEIL